MNFKTLVPAVGLSALTLAGCGKAAQKAAPEMKKATTEFVQKADTFVYTQKQDSAFNELLRFLESVVKKPSTELIQKVDSFINTQKPDSVNKDLLKNIINATKTVENMPKTEPILRI